MIRIILADDHDIVREGVRRILETYPDLEVVAEAADGDTALRACAHTQAQVLVLDMDMPGGGFNALKRITDAQIQIKVLVLTMHDNEEYALRALREGATGYMLKASPPGTLPEAIRKVAGGVRHVDPSIMCLSRASSIKATLVRGPGERAIFNAGIIKTQRTK